MAQLEDGELMRLSIYLDGAIIVRDKDSLAVANPLVAVSTVMGMYVKKQDEISLGKAAGEIIRAFMLGYEEPLDNYEIVDNQTKTTYKTFTNRKKDKFDRKDYE